MSSLGRLVAGIAHELNNPINFVYGNVDFLGQYMEDLLGLVGLERMPRHVMFGDGSLIPDATMAVVGATYEACAVRLEWRQGDVIMLDNMLAAHARDPYEGPRKIVVAMGAMFDRAALGGEG